MGLHACDNIRIGDILEVYVEHNLYVTVRVIEKFNESSVTADTIPTNARVQFNTIMLNWRNISAMNRMKINKWKEMKNEKTIIL